jgi:hypothetical protein
MANQRTQIYLEGVALDLDKNVDIDFTYSIADISDFEKRTTTFSKTIVLPGTAHNSFLLGNYFDFNINNDYSNILDNVGVNYNPLKKAFAKVTIDNVEVFAGVLRLLEITSKDGALEYQCALFGSLGGLFSTLGEKLLTDLDLDALDHTYNTTTIQNSWNTADVVAQGYVYPLANYGIGVNDDQNIFDVRNFRPAVSVKRVFDEIIDQAGYTYTGNFWNENNLDKLILQNGEEKLSAFYTTLGSLTINTNSGGNFSYSSSTLSGFTIDTATSPLKRIKNVTGEPIAVKFNFDLDIINSLAIFDAATIIAVVRNDVDPLVIKNQTTTYLSFYPTGGVTFSLTYNLEPLDSLDFVLDVFNVIGGSPTGTFTISNTSTISITPVTTASKLPIIYNSAIEGKSIVPEGVKQSEFIKNIINLLNLYIIQDPDNEFNLTFLPQPDFYLNQSVDWTDKKDLDKGFSIKPSTEFTPKSYSFKYKDDADYYSKTYKNKYADAYGNLKYETENEFSKDDIATEFFFALAPLTFYGGKPMAQLYDINTDGTFKQVKCNPKLAFWGGKKDSSAYTIKNGDTTLNAGVVYYGYAGHIYDTSTISDGRLWDLCFGTPKEIYFGMATYPILNLYQLFYKQFVDSQNNKDSKLVILYFLLNAIDIMNLSFQKYIKVDNGLYYLNKIDGYNPLSNELTKVELLRIVALEQLDAYVTYTPAPDSYGFSTIRLKVTLDRALPFNKTFSVQYRYQQAGVPATYISGTGSVTITAGNLIGTLDIGVTPGSTNAFTNIIIVTPSTDAGYIYVYGGDYTTD